MAKKPTKLTTTANGAVVTGKEDLTKIKTTTKTPEQAMDELTELSQELGLYDVEGNPLVKDESTVPVEATTEPLQAIAVETDPTVAQTDETPSSIGLEPLNATEQLGELLDGITEENKHPELIPAVGLDSPPVDDKLTLKDAWGRPIPTTLITLQTVNCTELVSQVLYAASLDAELDRSYRILTTVPYRLRLLLPTENYDKWLSKEDQIVFDEQTTYNSVIVKSYDLYGFWRNVIKIGREGAIVKPRHVAQKRPMYMVPILTRNPTFDTPESRMGREKVKYTRPELESFSLESLKACASWYNIPSSNSKLKYVNKILEMQG